MNKSFILMLCARIIGALKDLLVVYLFEKGAELDFYFMMLFWMMVPVVWVRDAYVGYFMDKCNNKIRGLREICNARIASLLVILSLYTIIYCIQGFAASHNFYPADVNKNMDIIISFANLFIMSSLIGLFLQVAFSSMGMINANHLFDVTTGLFIIIFLYLHKKNDAVFLLAATSISQSLAAFVFVLIFIYLVIINEKKLKDEHESIGSIINHGIKFYRGFYVFLGSILQTTSQAIEQSILLNLGVGWLGAYSVASKFSGIINSFGVTVASREAIREFGVAVNNNFTNDKIINVLRRFLVNGVAKYGLIIFATIALIRFATNALYPNFSWRDSLYILQFLIVCSLINVSGQIFISLSIVLDKRYFNLLPAAASLLLMFAGKLFFGLNVTINMYLNLIIASSILSVLCWLHLFKINVSDLLKISSDFANKIIYGSAVVGKVKYIKYNGLDAVEKTLSGKPGGDAWLSFLDKQNNFISFSVNTRLTVPKILFVYEDFSKIVLEKCGVDNLHNFFKHKICGKKNNAFILAKDFGDELNNLHEKMCLETNKNFNFCRNLNSINKLQRNVFVHGDFVASNVLYDCNGIDGYKYYLIDFNSRNYSSDLNLKYAKAIVDYSAFVGSIGLIRGELLSFFMWKKNKLKIIDSFSVGYFGIESDAIKQESRKLGKFFIYNYFKNNKKYPKIISILLASILL